MRIFSSLLLFCFILAHQTHAMAESDKKAEALALFREGVKLSKEERYKEAAVAFRKANEIHPNWKIQHNIGQCEAASKRYGLALAAFEKYLAEGGDEIPRNRQEEVLEEMKRLQAIVGTFEIKAPPGSSVFVDDFERGTAPLSGPLYVAAGIEHDVRITREGATLLARKFRVGGGKNTVIKAEEQAAPPSAEEEPQPMVAEDVPAELPVEESGKPVNLKIVGWSTVGVGAAMLVAGAITGGLVASNAKTLSDNCPEKQCSKPGDKTLKKDGETLALVTDLLLPIGGAVAVAGAIILIVGHKKKEANTAHKNNTSLVLLPNLGGLVLEGRF